MIQIEVLDEARQKFSLTLEGRRVTMELWYSVTSDRWSFSLALDGDWLITGRRVVCGVDLLAPFQLGLGLIFALPEGADHRPGRNELINGLVRLYHASQEEIDAAVA